MFKTWTALDGLCDVPDCGKPIDASRVVTIEALGGYMATLTWLCADHLAVPDNELETLLLTVLELPPNLSEAITAMSDEARCAHILPTNAHK